VLQSGDMTWEGIPYDSARDLLALVTGEAAWSTNDKAGRFAEKEVVDE
jgi:hypothetical protein